MKIFKVPIGVFSEITPTMESTVGSSQLHWMDHNGMSFETKLIN